MEGPTTFQRQGYHPRSMNLDGEGRQRALSLEDVHQLAMGRAAKPVPRRCFQSPRRRFYDRSTMNDDTLEELLAFAEAEEGPYTVDRFEEELARRLGIQRGPGVD